MQARMRQAYLFAVVTVALVVFGGTALAQGSDGQRDPQIGTWKQNLAKSKYTPASLTPKDGTTVRREVAGDGYKVTTDGMNAQGATTHTEYTAATLDSKDYPLKGSADFDSVSLKKIDANTMITVNKKGGTVVRMLRTVVSKDGKTFTSDQLGYNAKGVSFHNVTVFDKQ